MALADTARLIASLELQDKFTGPAKRAEGAVGGLDKKMGTLGESGRKLGAGLGRAFSTIAKIGVGVAAGGVALLTVNIKAGIDALNELENVTVATETVLKSTDGVAGQTAKGVRDLAEEYESLNATIDDKVIQNAENLLLTFTNVRDKAFEPALAAALDLNEAMGGGEAGLQGTIIQLGKALNDPVKGVTKLTRVGVTFTEQQKKQIETLQENGDLLGAQQVILDELGTEFGGRFAAAGNTAEGSMARLGDAVEDLQKNLAGPMLPAIDRVRDKLADFLSSKQVQNAATELGDAIAGIFTNKNIDKGVGFLEDALQTVRRAIKGDGEGGGFEKITANIGTIAGTVAGLPWESIGNAARLLGTGSKALLDAFLGLPPWVQTAVLTGWGLNKLTGGALGGIVSELGKGLIKGVLGINAGIVNVNGPVAGGPGAPGGGGRGIAGGLAIAAGVGLSAVAVERLVDFGQDTAANTSDLIKKVEALPKQNATELNDSIDKLDGAIEEANQSIVGGLLGLNSAITPRLEAERRELITTRNDLARNIVRGTDQTSRTIDRVNSSINLERSAQQAIAAADAARINSLRDSHNAALGELRAIKAKKSSFSVTVNTETNVSLSASSTALYVQRITTSNNVNAPQPGAVS